MTATWSSEKSALDCTNALKMLKKACPPKLGTTCELLAYQCGGGAAGGAVIGSSVAGGPFLDKRCVRLWLKLNSSSFWRGIGTVPAGPFSTPGSSSSGMAHAVGLSMRSSCAAGAPLPTTGAVTSSGAGGGSAIEP